MQSDQLNGSSIEPHQCVQPGERETGLPHKNHIGIIKMFCLEDSGPFEKINECNLNIDEGNSWSGRDGLNLEPSLDAERLEHSHM